MKRSVYRTIAEKRAWQEPPEPSEAEREKAIGSKGWYTRGYLPHFDKPGTIQMVTFRLADAMPASRRHEWETLLALEDERERRTKLEAYLDKGYGACWLKDHRVAAIVVSKLIRLKQDWPSRRPIGDSAARIPSGSGAELIDIAVRIWSKTKGLPAQK